MHLCYVNVYITICMCVCDFVNINDILLLAWSHGAISSSCHETNPLKIKAKGTAFCKADEQAGFSACDDWKDAWIPPGVFFLFAIIVVVLYHVILIILWTAKMPTRMQKQFFLTAQVLNAWCLSCKILQIWLLIPAPTSRFRQMTY